MTGSCGSVGWGLDADRCAGGNFRIVQLTPAGSGSWIRWGTGEMSAAPCCAQDMCLIASSVEAARGELVTR